MSKNSDTPKVDGAAARSIQSAQEILAMEARAITAVSQRINSQFHSAVCLIRELPAGGRVVTSGMGKAGFIAQKVSATFASTGIPSFFLHPAEAVHGDLGRYSKTDIALLFSNAGETAEILRIIPDLKRFGCSIIAVTSSATSTVGKHSDVVLELGTLDEAGPHALAPTTSTTAMLALGDALAMTVFEQHGYTREQFAAFHPGGSIGRSLMTVGEIMRKGEELCVVAESVSASDVLHKISATKGRPGAAAIVSDSGILTGVFTDGDLRRCLERNVNFLLQPITEVMGNKPKTILAEKFVTEALRLLSDLKIDQVIVVDALHRPVGLVDIQDLVEFKA